MSPLERAFSFVISAIVCTAILWSSVAFAEGCSGEVTTTTPAAPTSPDRRELYLRAPFADKCNLNPQRTQ